MRAGQIRWEKDGEVDDSQDKDDDAHRLWAPAAVDAGLTPINFLQPSYYRQFKSQLGEFGVS